MLIVVQEMVVMLVRAEVIITEFTENNSIERTLAMISSLDTVIL